MSGDEVDAELLDRIAARALASSPRPVLLVDGGSGSGKTTLAEALRPRVETGAGTAQLVSLDDVYPGWDGLAEGSRAVREAILRTERPGWRAWDWTAGRPGAWHELDPARPLIVEGCGALSAANRARASIGAWLELDEAERKRRALARDGELYAPHWDRWAAQEAAFRRAEPPHPLADLVLDVAALGL